MGSTVWSRENNPPWELDWDVIEARLLVWVQWRKIYNYYRQRLTKTASEEWVITVKKPLKLTEAQLGQLGFKTLDLDQLDFRQWDLDPNDQYDSELPGLVASSSESEDDSSLQIHIKVNKIMIHVRQWWWITVRCLLWIILRLRTWRRRHTSSRDPTKERHQRKN
jgi:hypothetical protein